MHAAKKLNIKPAVFPAVMTVISFVLFFAAYRAVTKNVIEPYYYEGLIFALPVVCFGIVSLLSVKNIIKAEASSLLTISLIIFLGIVMVAAFTYMIIGSLAKSTTDVSSYERVLNLSNLPDSLVKNSFPEEIPDKAENISFSYNSDFNQKIALKYKTDKESIKKYITVFTQKAKWIGKADDREANKYGIFNSTLNVLDYSNKELPDGFIVYVIYGKSIGQNDWNHGERSLVAINEKSNEIMFLANKW